MLLNITDIQLKHSLEGKPCPICGSDKGHLYFTCSDCWEVLKQTDPDIDEMDHPVSPILNKHLRAKKITALLERV